MSSTPDQPAKKKPPASLFALGRKELPPEISMDGRTWRFVKWFKHDFFAATGLYEDAAVPGAMAVLKVQRTYHYWGFPMRWLGKLVAGHEIKLYQKLQGIRGIPAFLGRVGATGFLHEFIPGTDLHSELPLTPQFFEELHELFATIHARNIAYVDANKRENILYGSDGKPWLIDFQISYEISGWRQKNFMARWLLRKFIRGDWYHFYKHKSRLLPGACSPEDIENGKKRGFFHGVHRFFARPIIAIRRRYLSKYDLANTR